MKNKTNTEIATYELITYHCDIETIQHLRVKLENAGTASYSYRNGSRAAYFDSGKWENRRIMVAADHIARELGLNGILPQSVRLER